MRAVTLELQKQLLILVNWLAGLLVFATNNLICGFHMILGA